MRRADALAWMAERVFESGDSPALASERHEIVVHVDADVLAGGGAFRFTAPHGWAVRPPPPREASSPDAIVAQNRNLGLAIDFETATAHWHGERIDYDHALMVTMASWDSGDTRPEAGPAAGDWNPS